MIKEQALEIIEANSPYSLDCVKAFIRLNNSLDEEIQELEHNPNRDITENYFPLLWKIVNQEDLKQYERPNNYE